MDEGLVAASLFGDFRRRSHGKAFLQEETFSRFKDSLFHRLIFVNSHV
jgi:hypothetical protein